MLYHYTDRLSAADILETGVISANPIVLHKDIWKRDEGFKTEPIVWLSIDPTVEWTVVHKMAVAGWPKTLVNDLWRFVLPHDYASLGLPEYSDQYGIDPTWWDWAKRTGKIAGSDHTTWRLVPENIAISTWLRLEVLTALDSIENPIWEVRATF